MLCGWRIIRIVNGDCGSFRHIKDQTAFARVQTGVTIPAYKAYLMAASEARFLLLDFGTTGIAQVYDLSEPEPTDGNIYNINGQRVSSAYKGIVIINGKKVVKR